MFLTFCWQHQTASMCMVQCCCLRCLCERQIKCSLPDAMQLYWFILCKLLHLCSSRRVARSLRLATQCFCCRLQPLLHRLCLLCSGGFRCGVAPHARQLCRRGTLLVVPLLQPLLRSLHRQKSSINSEAGK